ncbi:MAG TPA: hydrogenase formation protein HypD [Clostridiales bacterium]|nr:hydrogenase formation protein HypD [Clostridiales bacterium]
MIDYKKFLKEYDGRSIKIMEVCGTHTAEIAHNGISGMLSENINLVSGPGCPVCVTVTAYIDKLIELSKNPNNVIATFGDMLRVTGKSQNLNDVRAMGADIQMVYSPMDMLKFAAADKTKTFIFAAVGFETTTPVYALLLEEAIKNGITNIKLLTSLKTMPAVIDWVCAKKGGIDGFLAPGHVSVITGSQIFNEISEKHNIPFAVSGFNGEQILAALCALVKSCGKPNVINLYPSVVTEEGNQKAQKLVEKYFSHCDAAWRGMSVIKNSGMMLKDEYLNFDAGSVELITDQVHNPKCRCAHILIGSLKPYECPLFGKECTPQSQQGACMVSTEGSCYNYYINKR